MAYNPGSMPFEGINAAKAMANMREVLSAINLLNADKYRTHDLKRGHTRDMMRKGHNLKEILVAADWRLELLLTNHLQYWGLKCFCQVCNLHTVSGDG